MSAISEWVWMPHPGHLCVARDCRFHLCTYVGGYIVSTVGEYLPDAPVREILAESRKVSLTGRGDERLTDYMEKIGYGEVGAGRKYETMVFKAGPSAEECCPYRATNLSELYANGYNDPGVATTGHMELCHKWGSRMAFAKEAKE